MAWLRPGLLLRVESLVIAGGLLVLYNRIGGSWLLFFGCILAPDLSILASAAGNSVGAAVYNLVHTYVLPVGLVGYGVLGDHALALQLALIWRTHISVDRMLGFGLKYATGFKDTHLNRV